MADWQPIETAPKDGSLVLVYTPPTRASRFPYQLAAWASRNGQAGWVTDNYEQPTHWWDFGDGQTMPDPPRGEKVK